MARGIEWVAVVLAVPVTIALAACSGDDDRITPPSSSPAKIPSATAESSSLLEPPVRPVDRLTEASAIGFIQYFWETYNYAFDTLDPSYLEDASDPSCQFCSGSADTVRELGQKSSRIDGGTVRLVDATVQIPQRPQDGTIRTVISQEPSVEHAPAASPAPDPGWRRVPSEVALTWRSGHWSMSGVTIDTKNGQPWSK